MSSIPEYGFFPENDSRWTAVDHYTTSHLHTTSPEYLQSTLSHSRSKGLPAIETYPSQGKSLAILARSTNAKHILEIGTLGGYTCLAILALNPDVRITTIEVDSYHAAVAAENIKNAGFGVSTITSTAMSTSTKQEQEQQQISIIIGSALDVLPNLVQELKDGKRQQFDMVFIDADKENSDKYFDISVGMCRSGALVYVDNVVRKGMIADEEKAKQDSRVEGSRRVIESVGKDKRVEATVLQTVAAKNYDGHLLAVVL